MRNKVFLLFVILLVVFPLISAHGEVDDCHDELSGDSINLPPALQKINEYNNEQAQFYLRNLSFVVAFLAGMLGLLTPCSLAILPAFFAYSFEGRKEITKMTFIFFLGFAPVFVVFGLLATFFGKTLAIFQQDYSFWVLISGIFLIGFGLMVLFGKGFSGFNFNRKTEKTSLGIFLFGIFFAVGFTACMGPILVGILLIAGILQNYVYAGFLMLFYSLGLFVPLFLISMFFDKFNFSKFMGEMNRQIGFSITNVIAGVLLIGLGLVFVIYRGTYIANQIGFANISRVIYDLQEKVVLLPFVNIIGGVVLVGFLLLLWRFLRKNG